MRPSVIVPYQLPALLLVVAAAVVRAGHSVHDSIDYYSEPNYHFNYGVKDLHTGDLKSQWEHRKGDVVKGSYSVMEPDGSIRTVDYTADDHNGFNAVVSKSGHGVYPAAAATAPVAKHQPAAVALALKKQPLLLEPLHAYHKQLQLSLRPVAYKQPQQQQNQQQPAVAYDPRPAAPQYKPSVAASALRGKYFYGKSAADAAAAVNYMAYAAHDNNGLQAAIAATVAPSKYYAAPTEYYAADYAADVQGGKDEDDAPEYYYYTSAASPYDVESPSPSPSPKPYDSAAAKAGPVLFPADNATTAAASVARPTPSPAPAVTLFKHEPDNGQAALQYADYNYYA